MTGRVVPIWSPKDSIDTAQQFALELHNAERGESVRANDSKANERGLGNRLLFSASRHRKARLMDGLAVALLLITMALLGAVSYYAGGAR